MTPDGFEKKEVVGNLYRHVHFLSVTIGDRYLWKENSLDRTAEYIEAQWAGAGYPVRRQSFACYGKTVGNLLIEKPGREKGLIVVGAHYDTVPGTPGADDNASGVAVLLELARLLQGRSSRKTLLLVAFVNEEPPFFGSKNMGSMVCAGDLKERGARVEAMLSLEMLGYFGKGYLQRFPLPGMELFYPRTGNFLAVVGNFASRREVSRIRRGINKFSRIQIRSLTAPEFFGGINLSDHSSFWAHGFPAVMVTDTSFFRNRHYHQESDTIDTLNFDQMAEVVKGLYWTLLNY
ncbi:MAG: M20/M25/M40 family metallo-hydrolase [Deltaproteobacteria bacterium]|nr:M20/M25/M40 family metallo-hydrolase [Deltaproteobacteria bacterium]